MRTYWCWNHWVHYLCYHFFRFTNFRNSFFVFFSKSAGDCGKAEHKKTVYKSVFLDRYFGCFFH